MLVRITRGGRSPHVSFYAAETRSEMGPSGKPREIIGSIRYVGWRRMNRVERDLVRRYRPAVISHPLAEGTKRTARTRKNYLSFQHLSSAKGSFEYPRPRTIKMGPSWAGPAGQPIQRFRARVTYIDPDGKTRTKDITYRFYDKASVKDFRALEESKRLPIPKRGDEVDYHGRHGREYRLRRFKSRRRGHGS